jgi:hypothetical protein
VNDDFPAELSERSVEAAERRQTPSATWLQNRTDAYQRQSPPHDNRGADWNPQRPWKCCRSNETEALAVELVSGVENIRRSVRQPSQHGAALKHFQGASWKEMTRFSGGRDTCVCVGPRLAMERIAMNFTRTGGLGHCCLLDYMTRNRLGSLKTLPSGPEKEL